MTTSSVVTAAHVRSEAERLRDLAMEAQTALERCQMGGEA
jgi:hypothetical protein